MKVLRFVLRADGSLRSIAFGMANRFRDHLNPAVNATEWEGKPAGTCLLRGARGAADSETSSGPEQLKSAIEIDVHFNPAGWGDMEAIEFHEIHFGQFVGEFDAAE